MQTETNVPKVNDYAYFACSFVTEAIDELDKAREELAKTSTERNHGRSVKLAKAINVLHEVRDSINNS